MSYLLVRPCLSNKLCVANFCYSPLMILFVAPTRERPQSLSEEEAGSNGCLSSCVGVLRQAVCGFGRFKTFSSLGLEFKVLLKACGED